MARVIKRSKAAAVNPLKNSQPLGGALAFLGLDRCMPIFHGSQGCTSFAKAMLTRHFREAIPLQTSALSEVTTVLGGGESLIAALANIAQKQKPDVIGLCSTGLTETKGDDVDGALRDFRQQYPQFASIPVVYASTPDYKGAAQDGYARVVERVVEELAVPGKSGDGGRLPWQVNILAGPALTPGDVDEVKEIVAAFGLTPVVLPDLSASLDGHIADDYSPLTLGGTRLAEIRELGRSKVTIALGESMRGAAEILHEKCGVPYRLFDRLTGLEPCDQFYLFLTELSGRPVPEKFRRQRRRLIDGMLDAQFFFGRKKVALALEPDLLWTVSAWLSEMGAEVQAAVTTTQSPLLERIPVAEVHLGDLEDLEELGCGADLLVTNSNGRHAAEKLDAPLLRMGMPVFDRLGAQHRVSVGYRGTLGLLFETGNLLLAHLKEKRPYPRELREAAHASRAALAQFDLALSSD